jgi:hypothetical protein
MGAMCAKPITLKSFKHVEKPYTGHKDATVSTSDCSSADDMVEKPNVVVGHVVEENYIYAVCSQYNTDKMLELQEKGFNTYEWADSIVKFRKKRPLFLDLSKHRFLTSKKAFISGTHIYLGRILYLSEKAATREVVLDEETAKKVRISAITLKVSEDGQEIYVSNGTSFSVYFQP